MTADLAVWFMRVLLSIGLLLLFLKGSFAKRVGAYKQNTKK